MITSYSSIYDLKTFMSSSLVPKYFDTSLVSDLNLGLLGYTSELVASVTDDTFNTVATYMNEMFPNLAILPESIYNYGALFQLGQEFATPAQMTVFLFVAEDDIIRYMSLTSPRSDVSTFYIDCDTVIDVEGIQFMPDYDIRISVKPWIDKTKQDYVYTAEYVKRLYNTSYNNTISTTSATNDPNPYIKLARIKYDGVKYLALMVTVQQVNKFVRNEDVINNDILTPVFEVTFDNKLANFEVFYKAPNSANYKQLKKRMVGTTPISEDFCYYRIVDENKLEISFSMRDTYFQPEFNSEIVINYYTTLGDAGNFDQYTGNDIIVRPSSTRYIYNNSISMFAVTQSASKYGADNITLEELKNITVESFSTVKSYTTENDLMMYFDRFNEIYNTRILFIKRRDDIFERLFSSFTIYESDTGEIFGTNTLNLQIPMPDDGNKTPFDIEKEQDNLYVIKPGRIFTYKPGILDTSIMKSSQFIYDGEYVLNEDGETEYKYDVDLDNVVPDIYYDPSYSYRIINRYLPNEVVYIIEKNTEDTVDEYNPGTIYSRNDIVFYKNSLYKYNRDEKSIVNEIYFNDNFIQFTDIDEYHVGKKYIVGELTYINNKIYRCIANTNSGEFDYNYWEPFATKKVYKCKFENPVGEFNPSNWIDIAEKFVYTNPYMIYLAKDPIVVGYYLNTVNDRYLVDYYNDYFYAEDDSYLQFICNSLKITRDAIFGEDCYTVTIMLTPTSTFTENPLVLPNKNGTYTPTDNLFIELAIANEDDVDLAYSISPNPDRVFNNQHLGYLDENGFDIIILDDALKNDTDETVRYDLTLFEDVLDEDNNPIQYVYTDMHNYSWVELTEEYNSKVDSTLPVIYGPNTPTAGDYSSGQVYRKITDDSTVEWVCTHSNSTTNSYIWNIVTEENTNEISRDPEDNNKYLYEIIYGLEDPVDVPAKKGQVYKKIILRDDDLLYIYIPQYRWELLTEETKESVAYEDGNLKYIIKYCEIDNPNNFGINESIEGIPGQIYQRVKIIDKKDDNLCRMYLDSYDIDNDIYTFVGKIKTNDNIEVKTSVTSSYNKFEITNMYSAGDGIIEGIFAPMTNCIVKIWTWYKPSNNSKYLLTNEYRTNTNKVTFIYPINMMRSYAKYEDNTITTYLDSAGNVSDDYIDEDGNPTYTLYAKLYNVLEGYKDPNGIDGEDNVAGELGQLYKITNIIQIKYKDELFNTITENIGTEYTFYQCRNIISNMHDNKQYEWVEVYKTITDTLNINPNNYHAEIPGTLGEYFERSYNGSVLIYQCTKEGTKNEWCEWTLVDNVIDVDGIPDKTIVAEYGIGQLARMLEVTEDDRKYKYYRCSNEFADNTKKIAMDPFEPDEYLYPVIKGSGEPDDNIKGIVGQVYQVGEVRWVCTANTDVYTWEPVTDETYDKIAKDPDDPSKYMYDITYAEGNPTTDVKGEVGQVYNSVDDIGWVCVGTGPRYYWEKVTDLNVNKIAIDPHRSDVYAHPIKYNEGNPTISTKGFIGQVYQSILEEYVCTNIEPEYYKWEILDESNKHLIYKGDEEYGLYAAELIGPNPLTDVGDIIGEVFIGDDIPLPDNSSGKIYTSVTLHPDKLKYPIRTGGGEPTTSTVGSVGQIFKSIDDDDEILWVCTLVKPMIYNWELLTDDNRDLIAIDKSNKEHIYPTNYCLYSPTTETEGNVGQVHAVISDTEWVCYDITLDKYDWELLTEDNVGKVAVDDNGNYIFDIIYVKGDEPTDYTKGIVGQVYKIIGDTEWVCTNFRIVYTWEKVNSNNGVTEYTWKYFGETDSMTANILTYTGVDFNKITKTVDNKYGYYIYTVPLVKASTMRDKKLSDEFYSYLYAQYKYISGIIYQVTNNYGIDMKFYNTYGKSKNFYIGDNADELLDRVDIKLYIQINPIYVGEEYEKELIRDIKIYIKNYIESINNEGTNSIYISNLIQSLENDFEEIKYMKWVRFNEYDPSYQVIENKTTDLSTLNKDDRLNYTPEYLTISYDDINIEII